MKELNVANKDSGSRLDKYLVSKLNMSRNDIKGLIDCGRVIVNGRRVVIAKWNVNEGDKISIKLDGWTGKSRGRQKLINDFVEVVFEDRDIIVVEKPAGAIVQMGKRKEGHTFVDSIKAYLKRKTKGKASFVEPVHRLDRETSGLMVFAKSKTGEKLTEQFKKHDTGRSYLAVVEGAVNKENGKIDVPIKKGDFGYGRKAGIVRNGEGFRAITLFRVIERYKKATFVQLDLHTGRTHQARVHMASLGHPILGDKIYGRSGEVSFPRQALHSYLLTFKHPASGKVMKFKSGLPKDMAELVDVLRGD